MVPSMLEVFLSPGFYMNEKVILCFVKGMARVSGIAATPLLKLKFGC